VTARAGSVWEGERGGWFFVCLGGADADGYARVLILHDEEIGGQGGRVVYLSREALDNAARVA